MVVELLTPPAAWIGELTLPKGWAALRMTVCSDAPVEAI